jgi:hypothetical protein
MYIPGIIKQAILHAIKIGSYLKQEHVKVDCYNLVQLTRSLIHV